MLQTSLSSKCLNRPEYTKLHDNIGKHSNLLLLSNNDQIHYKVSSSMSSSNEGTARMAGLLSVMCSVLVLSRPSLLERTPLVAGGLLRTSILLEALKPSPTGVARAPNSCCMRLDFRSFPKPLLASLSLSVSTPLRLKTPIASKAESLSSLGGGEGKPGEHREDECAKDGA